jgi:tRNA pseudouridine38-40 synthase
VRRVLRSGVRRQGDMIYFVIEATGFLRYMVRNLMGTLVLVGSGKMTLQGFEEVLRARDREKAGPTAPPQGLFLRRIRYEGERADEEMGGWDCSIP